MQINQEEVKPGISKINLSGRMDIAGVEEIENKFSGMSAAPTQSIIVDMSGVGYMSSIGIRALLLNAKSVTGRGGKFVLLNPQPVVKRVLETSGIDQLIGLYENLDTAIAKVTI